MANGIQFSKSELKKRIEQNREKINALEKSQFKNDIFSLFFRIEESEFEEYMRNSTALSTIRMAVVSDMEKLIEMQKEEIAVHKQAEAYKIVLDDIKQALNEQKEVLAQNNEELNDIALKVVAIIGQTTVGYKYLSDRFESLSDRNESIFGIVEDIREVVFELDKEINKKTAPKQEIQNEAEPNA